MAMLKSTCQFPWEVNAKQVDLLIDRFIIVQTRMAFPGIKTAS